MNFKIVNETGVDIVLLLNGYQKCKKKEVVKQTTRLLKCICLHRQQPKNCPCPVLTTMNLR